MPIVKAVRVHEYGGPDKLRYEDVEVGESGDSLLEHLVHYRLGQVRSDERDAHTV